MSTTLPSQTKSIHINDVIPSHYAHNTSYRPYGKTAKEEWEFEASILDEILQNENLEDYPSLEELSKNSKLEQEWESKIQNHLFEYRKRKKEQKNLERLFSKLGITLYPSTEDFLKQERKKICKTNNTPSLFPKF